MTTGSKFAQMIAVIALFIGGIAAVLLIVGRAKGRRSEWWQSMAFVAPTLVLLGVGLIYPAVRTLYNSFFNQNSSRFVGLANYETLLTQRGYLDVIGTTFIWVVVAPLLATGIGLVYAVLVNRVRFESFAKALIFLPTAISFVAASVIWEFMYTYRPVQPGVSQIGFINQVLVWFGRNPTQFLLRAPVDTLALIAIMVWIEAGFAMIVLSAAVKNISGEIVEAARIDGASGWRMFRHITVPSVRPTIVIVLTTVFLAVLKIFDIVQTLTGGNYGTNTLANLFFEQSFQYFNFGIGSAVAVLLSLLVIPLVLFNLRELRKAGLR